MKLLKLRIDKRRLVSSIGILILCLEFSVGYSHAQLSERNANVLITSLLREKKHQSLGLYQKKDDKLVLMKEIRTVPGIELVPQLSIQDAVRNDFSTWSKVPDRVAAQYLLFQPRLHEDIVIQRCLYPIIDAQVVLSYDKNSGRSDILVPLNKFLSE